MEIGLEEKGRQWVIHETGTGKARDKTNKKHALDTHFLLLTGLSYYLFPKKTKPRHVR